MIPSRNRLCFAPFSAAVAFALVAGPAPAQVLLVANTAGNTIGKYDALTGATINANFISSGQGLSEPTWLAVDGNNHLLVVNGIGGQVGQYNATTGATINSNFISNGSQGNTVGLTLDHSGNVFVRYSINLDHAVIGRFDASTGTPVNANMISFLSYAGPIQFDGRSRLLAVDAIEFPDPCDVHTYDPTTGADTGTLIPATFALSTPRGMVSDTLGHLFIANFAINTVSEFSDAGALLNATFISGPGLNQPWGLALDGNNHLFVTNYGSSTVGEYDATTGAVIDQNFITGLDKPDGIVFLAPVPEPSSLLLVTAAAGIAVRLRRRAQPRSGDRQ